MALRKLILFCLVLLTSSQALTANYPLSLTLYSGENLSGNQLEIYGEHTVHALSTYYGVTQISGSSTGIDGRYVQQEFENLAPAGENNIESLIVSEGYCAVITTDRNFEGTWGVLSAGTYNSLGGFANQISSIATFKDYYGHCNALSQIPMFYDGTNLTGNKLPLVVKAGSSATEYHGFMTSQNPLTSWVCYDQFDPRIYPSIFPCSGFVDKAASLKVPNCYSVTVKDAMSLTKLSAKDIGGAILRHSTDDNGEEVQYRSGGIPSGYRSFYDPKEHANENTRTFGPGLYPDLSVFGFSNNIEEVTVNRDEDCMADLEPSHNPAFERSDLIRIQNFWNHSAFINIEYGVVEASDIDYSWHSAHWKFEPVGNGYYRIRNAWKPEQYLHIENGALESSEIPSGWWSAQWKLVRDSDYEGHPNDSSGKIYKIQNRWKSEQYIHIENGVIESGAIESSWWSARWNIHDL